MSSNYLTALLKELYCDMIIIPAFSKTNRLTRRGIEPLALERIIAVVCNACSSLCGEGQGKWDVSEEMIGKEIPFCYLCMPAKGKEDNSAVYYTVKHNEKCIDCDICCPGHFFKISFTDCIYSEKCFLAKVVISRY